MRRGELYWANLGVPDPNEPGYRRPVLVVQSDLFNRSKIPTVLVAPLTTNLTRARAPGNLELDAQDTGLPKDCVVNVSQIIAISRTRLDEYIATIDPEQLYEIDNGIRLIFDV